MKLATNLLLILFLLTSTAYAGENHQPQNVQDDGSNHNALAIAVVIGAGICVYHRCWAKKPEPFTKPETERIIIRQKR